MPVGQERKAGAGDEWVDLGKDRGHRFHIEALSIPTSRKSQRLQHGTRLPLPTIGSSPNRSQQGRKSVTGQWRLPPGTLY